MYLLVVFLPLIGAFVSGFFGRFLGSRGSMLVSTTCVGITALISCFIFYEVGLSQSICSVKVAPWIDSGIFYVSWGFLFDSLTAVMLIVVTVISFFVHLYSMGYMEGDPHLSRFFSYLSLFTFFMLMLITADNLVQTFLGWEGVGLASYLLINFWFTRLQANKAALKAIIVNRVGDFGLGLAILTAFWIFKSTDFSVMFSTVHLFVGEKFHILGYSINKITLLSILLFLGAVGKSAQVGLHTWLPDAMEGPTPVSALIHAATMVTAGVFVILRCSPLLEYSPTALTIVTIMGALTAFFAATTGMLQNDLKRVIAYSTCSQLGYMVFACGISSYSVSLFHLMNHAFFKALLFLSAGAVIHAVADEQDMRKMGGLVKVVPFTYVMMLIGSLSLMGFPFLTGFYSKDVILEMAYTKSLYTIDGTFAYWLGTISAFFTAFYSFRLIYLTFLSDSNSYRKYIQNAHDAPLIMAIPLMSLCLGSIFVGYIMKDMIIGMGTDFWNNALFTLPENVLVLEAEFLPAHIKMIPVIFSFIGAGLALILNCFLQEIITIFTTFKLYIYVYKKKIHNIEIFAIKVLSVHLLNFSNLTNFKFNNNNNIIFEFMPINIPNLYKFLNKKWYFDVVYNKSIVKLILSFGYNVSFKYIDRGLIEVIGPLGITRTMQSRIKSLHKFQGGFIDQYIFVVICGLVFILFPVVLVNNEIINSLIKFIDLDGFFNYCVGSSMLFFQSKFLLIESLFVWIWRVEMVIYLLFSLIIILLFEDFLKVKNFKDSNNYFSTLINKILLKSKLVLKKR